ncbi:MAG: tetratricopeptide repeat protein [Chitinophagales bacterium]|nr:tetratricopeptide repeat protein [Chitinophagales bacterium]
MFEEEFNSPDFGEIIELIQQYEAAMQTNTAPHFDEESFEKIILYYQDNREFKKAMNVIDSAIEQFPFSGEFLLKKAEVFAEQNRLDDALEFIGYAEVLDPSDVRIALTRADILLFKGEHEAALAEIENGFNLAESDADRCELFLEKADVFEDKERYAEVIESLQQALHFEPENEEALNRLWFAYELTERYDNSIAFHKALIETMPYNHLAWFNLGHAYAGKQDWNNAQDAFEYVVAIKEEFDAGYICIADVLFMKEEYATALNFYHEAIKIGKPQKELYLKTGECYEKVNDIPKARNFIRKAIAIDPHYAEAFYLLGETYKKEENWSQAISAYERAVKLSKENIDYLLGLADACLQIEDIDKAVALFEQILETDSKFKGHWINLAAAYYELEDYEAAFALLKEAEIKFEGEADIIYIKAVFYYQAGIKHEAILSLEKALMLNFDLHTIIFELFEELKDDAVILQVIEQYRD